jgi:hypothetical protein
MQVGIQGPLPWTTFFNMTFPPLSSDWTVTGKETRGWRRGELDEHGRTPELKFGRPDEQGPGDLAGPLLAGFSALVLPWFSAQGARAPNSRAGGKNTTSRHWRPRPARMPTARASSFPFHPSNLHPSSRRYHHHQHPTGRCVNHAVSEHHSRRSPLTPPCLTS